MYDIDKFKIDEERAARRARYWTGIRLAKQEYDEISGHTGWQYSDDANAFYYFLQDKYGVRPNMSDGKFTDSYQIVDDQKYLLFQIKYAV